MVDFYKCREILVLEIVIMGEVIKIGIMGEIISLEIIIWEFFSGKIIGLMIVIIFKREIS